MFCYTFAHVSFLLCYMCPRMCSRTSPLVLQKTAAMQRLADLVRTGHRHYVTGAIEADAVARVHQKMARLYHVDEHRVTAHRKRKSGAAAFRMIFFAESLTDPATKIYFILLRTDGEMPPEAEREKWRNAEIERISVTGYELVRQTRKGRDHPSWTWRYTKAREEEIRCAIIHAIRARHDDELKRLIYSIARTPGFAAARQQAKKCFDLMRAEWKRSRSGEFPYEIPRVGYVRRIPSLGMKASEIGKKKRATRMAARQQVKKGKKATN